MSEAQKRQLRDWRKAGESTSQTARALDKPPGSVFTVLKSTGGYAPPARRRRPGSLTVADRDEVSRGLARGGSLRQVARVLGRLASMISQEVARNRP
jgi:IS30 family transposase